MFNKHPFQAIGTLGPILCLFYSTVLFAQIDTAWVRRYNGPGNDGDAAYAIALRSDTVYVAGNSYGDGTSDDYATVKYLPNGDTAWVRRYNGPMGDGWDYANAIAVDGTGNVYVTGRSFGSWDISDDYATVKYLPNGDTAWVSRYNGPGNGGDMPYGLTVDGEENVYVTGASATNSNWPNNFDYATVKYNSTGVQQWVARYTGPGNPEYDDDYAKAIAVDGTGNVYVTGHSCGSDSSDDYATIKYNSDGVQQWVRRYNGPGNDGDAAYAIALRSDTVYVTGNSYGDGTSDDYATVKYLPNGDTAWVRRYNGPMGDGWDYANAIAVDGTGNVYVTGRSFGSWDISDDYATVKYLPNGDTAWVSRYNGPGNGGDMPYGLTVDGEENVYVTGASATNSNWPNNFDYATVKYNSTGVQQWVARYTGPGNPEYDDDYAKAIAVDGTGNVYVTGHSCGSDSSDDYTTIKYNQEPGVAENEPKNISGRVFFSHNCPNPFSGFTQINYGVPHKMAVNLSIYNAAGQFIETLVDDIKEPGHYVVIWNGTDNMGRAMAAGVYFLRMMTNDLIETRKLIRIR